jgi:hypothetical protein
MSAESDVRSGKRSPAAAAASATPAAANDDAIKVLTDILRKVGANLDPRPLSQKAEDAVAAYKSNRATLDHDVKTPPTP